MHETRRRSSARAVETGPNERPVDDWLGEISDDDWSEKATERAARRGPTPAYRELSAPDRELLRDPADARPPPGPLPSAEAQRAVIERRRLVAGLVLAVVFGLAVAIPVLLLRGGGDQARVTIQETTTTTAAPSETSPSPAPTTPSATNSTPPPATTTPSTGDAPSFTLPEGTKLQREGEGEPALTRELQRALARAGFDPGPADGTFGRRTEAAVVAFQEANGLSVDGRVGPETAEALNQALANG